MHLIRIHNKLAIMRDTIPRLEAFKSKLPKHSDELNKVKLRLAHRDLHFANILYDAASGEITYCDPRLGILMWCRLQSGT